MLKHFRTVGFLEGTSFIALLGIAMPLKYFGGIPEAVKAVGWAHGLLFMLYIGLALKVGTDLKWPGKRILGALVAAVVPFGPFIFDRHLHRQSTTSR